MAIVSMGHSKYGPQSEVADGRQGLAIVSIASLLRPLTMAILPTRSSRPRRLYLLWLHLPLYLLWPYSPPGHRGQEGGGRGQEGRGIRRGRRRPPPAGAAARCGLCSPLAVATSPWPGGRGRGGGRGPRGRDHRRQTLDRFRRGGRRGRVQTLRLKRQCSIRDDAPPGTAWRLRRGDAALPCGVRPPADGCWTRRAADARDAPAVLTGSRVAA